MKRRKIICAIAATSMTFMASADEVRQEGPSGMFGIKFGAVLAEAIECTTSSTGAQCCPFIPDRKFLDFPEYTMYVTPITRQVYQISASAPIDSGDVEERMNSTVCALENEYKRKAQTLGDGKTKAIIFGNGDLVGIERDSEKLRVWGVRKRLWDVRTAEKDKLKASSLALSTTRPRENRTPTNAYDLWKAYRVFLDANYTSLKRDAEWQKFAGKQMTCTGRFQDAGNALFGGTYVTVIVDEKWVKLMIDSSEKDKVMSLQKGDQITVVGRVSSRGDLLHCITLENGKVIKQ